MVMFVDVEHTVLSREFCRLFAGKRNIAKMKASVGTFCTAAKVSSRKLKKLRSV